MPPADCAPATPRSSWFQYGSPTRSWRVSRPSGPGRGSPWWSTGAFFKHHFSQVCFLFKPHQCWNLTGRHQRNGAVIARCSQPEISWWGWRNTDDEYLVTSIAKACQMATKGPCGASSCRQRGEAPDSYDGDFGKRKTRGSFLIVALRADANESIREGRNFIIVYCPNRTHLFCDDETP